MSASRLTCALLLGTLCAGEDGRRPRFCCGPRTRPGCTRYRRVRVPRGERVFRDTRFPARDGFRRPGSVSDAVPLQHVALNERTDCR